MKVNTSKPIPSAQDLIEILKHEFSSQYNYELFGLGKNKTIIVHQSTFVGAQISATNNEFMVVATTPSIASGLLTILLQWTADLFMMLSPAPYRKLEKEVSIFLQSKFN